MEPLLVQLGGDALPFNLGGLVEPPAWFGYGITAVERFALVEIERAIGRALTSRGIALERHCLS
jgi:hypothetical protein